VVGALDHDDRGWGGAWFEHRRRHVVAGAEPDVAVALCEQHDGRHVDQRERRDGSIVSGSTPRRPSSSASSARSTISAVRVAAAGSPAPRVYWTLIPGATVTNPRAASASAR
jgi:hypothetical protein